MFLVLTMQKNYLHHRCQLLVGCCVPPSNGGHLRPRVLPSCYLFCQIISHPQTMGNRPPHTFQPGFTSSPTHPLMLTPSSIWLLFILIKRWPSKAKAPLLSLLFDASYSPPQASKPTTASTTPTARGLHMALGSGGTMIWWLWGQSHWRVGWHGSSCWLLCLCVLCFVFCAPTNDQMTVLFFFGRNFFKFGNNWCSYFYTTDGYLRFISTVGQTTVPFFFGSYFFPVVIWTRRKT